jgi:hypothetical protein
VCPSLSQSSRRVASSEVDLRSRKDLSKAVKSGTHVVNLSAIASLNSRLQRLNRLTFLGPEGQSLVGRSSPLRPFGELEWTFDDLRMLSGFVSQCDRVVLQPLECRSDAVSSVSPEANSAKKWRLFALSPVPALQSTLPPTGKE